MQLSEAIRREKGDDLVVVEASALTWLAVQGSCELALRHPGNVGPSTELVKSFSEQLLKHLHEIGFLTDKGYAEAVRDQKEANLMAGKVEVYVLFRGTSGDGVRYRCRAEKSGTFRCGGCIRGVIRDEKQTHCKVCGRTVVFEYTYRPSLPLPKEWQKCR